MNNPIISAVLIIGQIKNEVVSVYDYFCPAKTFIMKFKSTYLWGSLLAFIFLLSFQESIGQCSNNGTFYIDVTPTSPGPAGAFVEDCIYGGDYMTCSVVSGDTYNFNTCGTTWNSIITLRNNATGALIAFNDNGGTCGVGPSNLDWTATFTGVVRIQTNTQPGCGTNTICGTLTVTRTAAVVEVCDPLYIGATQGPCDATGPTLQVVVSGSGDCAVTGIQVSVDGGPVFNVPLAAGALIGEAFTLTGALTGSSYAITGVLDNGDVTNTSTVTVTEDCAVTACQETEVTVITDCYGSEVNWVLTDAMGMVVHEVFLETFPAGEFTEGTYTTTMCLPEGCYDFTINDSYGDGLNPVGTTCTVIGDFSVALATGEILVDGDPSYGAGATFEFCVGGTTGVCSADGFSVSEPLCTVNQGLPVAIADFTFDFTGDCIVQNAWLSINGEPAFSVDISADGIVSGVPIGFLLDPDTEYSMYYELSDGSLSPTITFTTPSCTTGETICDCAGTVLPIEATSWLGDGFLDDGSYNWNNDPALPVNFNCSTWGFDCDDAGTGNLEDPFGVCDGNLPPGNGCIDTPPTCQDVAMVIQFDCWPGESYIAIADDQGNLLYELDPSVTPILENELVTENLCLAPGCYSFIITDSFEDGLSGVECADPTPGFFTVTTTEGELLVEGGGNFGIQYIQDFCIDQVVQTCSGLGLTVGAGYCTMGADGISLFPSVELSFNYTGDCEVASVFVSLDGVDYQEVIVNDGVEPVLSGSTLDLFNLEGETTYSFFYTLSDGSFSEVEIFTTGTCDNEITICDCAGTEHSIGVTSWLGDDFADLGGFDWLGQPVDFNCSTWGFDCGDIDGAPAQDPFGVCSGNLPPNNGCEAAVLGCTDPAALNYNPLATINDGSCIYNNQFGCTDAEACNYNPLALIDNGTCEYITCAGCTDDAANNYDPTATIDDGSCDYSVIEGCTDADALNYNPIATEDDGSCIYDCVWPTVSFVPHCPQGQAPEYYVTMTISALGNGAPYIVSNSENQEQYVVNFLGTIEVGPFPNNEQVLITVSSVNLDGCLITSPVLTFDCSDVSVNEVAAMDMLEVYPNPSNGRFQLVNKGTSEKMTVRVFDQTGKLVFNDVRVMNTGAVEQIDLSTLTAGTYHLEMIGNSMMQNETIVIQK